MKKTDQTLLEQMRISEFEIGSRQELFSFAAEDFSLLKKAKPFIEKSLDALVNQFYEMQTAVPEIMLLIGDSDTLSRLRNAQRRYILDLFSGYYDIEYVNNRLRIGLVHKRIGVEPRLYLAAVLTLRQLLVKLIHDAIPECAEKMPTIRAMDKLIMFDVSLVFDTYIRSLVSEIEMSRGKLEQYASVLEDKIRKRTVELETLSRTDSLTGLLNTRHLIEKLTLVLRAARRRNEPVTVAYVDIDDFKVINDSAGHQRGDEILRTVAGILQKASRSEDSCFRYGGDEFCIIMANCGLLHAREVWGTRVMQLLQEHSQLPNLSIGYVQTGPDEYVSAEELIRQADEEMYAVKRTAKVA